MQQLDGKSINIINENINAQLPETTDEKSEAKKYRYKNICEIEKERIRRADKKVFSIGFGALVVYLDNGIDSEVIEKIAGLKKKFADDYGLENMRVVFRDGSFENSVVKTNALAILKQQGIDEVVSV